MNRSSLSALTIVAAAFAPLGVQAATLHVPAAYSTIQLAIDAAVSGDVVRVAAGTYHENLLIDNKAVSVIGADAATTIIDGGAADSVFNISGAPGVTHIQVVLARLTIRHGAALNGGGVKAVSADLFLRDSVLTDNSGCTGAALFFEFGTLRLLRNQIRSTSSDPSLCPGIASEAVKVFVGGLNYFDYNVIADNEMAGMDAYSDGGTMHFRHNVFRNNVQFAGSIYTAGGLTVGGAFSLENNLFANNSGGQIGGVHLGHHDEGESYIRNNSFSGNDGARAGAIGIRGFVGSTVHVVNNLLNDDRDESAEIFCDPDREPVAIATSNVFASVVSAKVGGNCVMP